MIRRSFLPVFVFLAAVPVSLPVLANGPVYVTNGNHDTSFLQADPVRGWLEFLMRGTHTRAGDFSLDETIQAPGLHLATRGSLYHPSFMTFDLQGTASLERRVLSGLQEEDKRVMVEDYDASLRLLPEKVTNLRLFAMQGNDWITSPYTNSIRSTASHWGAEAHSGTTSIPVTLTWTREEFREEYPLTDRLVERERLRLGAQRRGRRLRASLIVRHEGYQQNLQPQDFMTDAANINATGLWGQGGRVHAHGRWLHRYGSRNNTDAGVRLGVQSPLVGGISGDTEIRHSQRRPEGGGGAEVVTSGGHLGLRHLLYGSLETSVRLHLLDESTTLLDEEISGLKDQGADLRLSYRRLTSKGTLALAYGWSQARREQFALSRELFVTNEDHFLSDGREEQLDRAGVILETVIITDASGFTVFEEGLDYELVVSGPYTSVWLLPAGNIPDGSTILVDYRYAVDPDVTYDTRGTRATARFDAHRLWSVWYRLFDTDETFVSGDEEFTERDQWRNLVGGRLRLGQATLEDEYELNRWLATRYRSNRMRLDYALEPGHSWRATAGIGHTWSWTNDPDRSQRFFQLFARARRSFGRGASADLEGWVRLDKNEGDGADASYDLAGLRLRGSKRIRALTLEGQIRFRQSDRNGVQDDRLEYRVGVRREF